MRRQRSGRRPFPGRRGAVLDLLLVAEAAKEFSDVCEDDGLRLTLDAKKLQSFELLV